MNRLSVLLLSVGAVFVLSGCLSSTTVVTVRPDGSGFVEETVTVSRKAWDALHAPFDEPDVESAPPTVEELFPEADAGSRAETLGKGIRLVSSTAIDAPAALGRRTVYAFERIADLQLPIFPLLPATFAGSSVFPEGDTLVTFAFAPHPNGNLVATAIFSEGRLEHDGHPVHSAPGEPGSAPDPAGQTRLKALLDNARVRLALAVEGTIVRTNTPFVDGDLVTLLDVDLERLLLTDAATSWPVAPGSLEQLRWMVKDLPGVKAIYEHEVTVEFVPPAPDLP